MTKAQNNQQTVSPEAVITRLLQLLAENKNARLANREMIDDYLAGFESFEQVDKQYTLARQERHVEKSRLMLLSQGAEFESKRRVLIEEKKELSESLSVHLQSLVVSGTNVVNVAGTELRIKVKCQVNTGQLPLF